MADRPRDLGPIELEIDRLTAEARAFLNDLAWDRTQMIDETLDLDARIAKLEAQLSELAVVRRKVWRAWDLVAVLRRQQEEGCRDGS
jgi:cell division septum initiation protein DivIVA